jgi:RNA polymerase sigma factor (sigma-70 family)
MHAFGVGKHVLSDSALRLPFARDQESVLSDRPSADDRQVDLTGLLALLYRQVRALAGARADLDDIVQAAAERALKALDRFEGRSEFSTWTYGVAWRTLLDHDRFYARWRRRLVYTRGGTPEAGLNEARSEPTSEHEVNQRRRAIRLQYALDQLPAEKRAVLMLHDVEGYTASEVAKILGTREGTVRSRLRDGRKKVLDLLRPDPLFDEGVQ